MQNDQGDTYLVNNVHTIDGKGHRKIHGKNVEARDRFKQSAVRHVLEQSFAMAPAATRGQITVGDFNMDLPCAQEALSTVGMTEMWAAGTKRDYVFSTLPLLLTAEASMPTAMDGQHKAMLATITLPGVAPPPPPLPPRGALEQKADARAKTLLQEFQDRQAEAQARQEAEANAEEEAHGRRHLQEEEIRQAQKRRRREDDQRRRDEELHLRRQEEDDRRRREQAQEEELRRQEEEQRRRAQEDLARRAEELRRFQEELDRRRQAEEEEEERRRREQERLRLSEEIDRVLQEQEQRRRQEEDEQRRRQEEQLRRQQEEDARRRQEEEDRRREEEEQRRREEEEEEPIWDSSDVEDSPPSEAPEESQPSDQEPDDVTPTATWGRMTSRWGVPTRALVVRHDHRGAWGVSANKTLASLTEALEVRLEELQRLELADTAFLPKAGQVRAQKELQKRWYRTELGQKILEEVGASWCVVVSSVSMSVCISR